MNWNCEGYQANKKREKMVEYDTPMHGQQNIAEVREQIQEDVLAYVEDKLVDDCYKDKFKDDLCQIVADNFKKLEK